MFTKHKPMIIGAALCAISFTGFVQSGFAQFNSTNDEVFIKQIGQINDVEVSQGAIGGTSLLNKASVYQKGETNIAFVVQGEENGFAEENVANLSQIGQGNAAEINQGTEGGTSSRGLVVLSQNGRFNTGAINQGNDAAHSGSDEVTLVQTGEANEAVIDQGNRNGFSAANITSLTQTGRENVGEIRVGNSGTALGNKLVANQSGNRNSVRLYQGYEGTSDAFEEVTTISQQGDDNYVNLDQGTFGGGSIGNTATVTQVGDRNGADVLQGTGNLFGTTITDTEAEFSLSTISQHGEDNRALTIQASENSQIDVTQNGNSNVAHVAQGTAVALP